MSNIQKNYTTVSYPPTLRNTHKIMVELNTAIILAATNRSAVNG